MIGGMWSIAPAIGKLAGSSATTRSSKLIPASPAHLRPELGAGNHHIGDPHRCLTHLTDIPPGFAV